MAAGLTLAEDRLEDFSTAFDSEVRRHLSAGDLRGVVFTDGPLTIQQMSLELAEQLRMAGPWGQGFPEPVFDGTFAVSQSAIVGDRHLKLKLTPAAGADSVPLDAIAFNTLPEDLPDQSRLIQCAYRLDVNEYRGQRTLQLIVEYIEAV